MAAVSSKHRPLPPARSGPLPRDPRTTGQTARTAARWADVLVALAATALTMAAVTLIAALAGENVAGDEAGRFWALLFAGALALCGLFLVALGLILLGDSAREGGRYVLPVAAGVATGAVVGTLMLDGAAREAVIAPLLLLLLATPPVREALAWLLRRQGPQGRGSSR